MKRAIAFMVIFMLVFALSACANDAEKTEELPQVTEEPAKKVEEEPVKEEPAKEVTAEPTEEEIEVSVLINGDTLEQEKVYTIAERDEITISSNGDRIVYKIGENDKNEIVGSSVTITIPERFTGTGEFSFYIRVVKGQNMTDWLLYVLSVEWEKGVLSFRAWHLFGIF